MVAWGFLVLGAGAALMTGFILARTRSSGATLLLLALTPVYASAALVFLHPQLHSPTAISFYPAGLLISFIWQQAWQMTDRIPCEGVRKWLPSAVCLVLLTVSGVLAFCAIRAT